VYGLRAAWAFLTFVTVGDIVLAALSRPQLVWSFVLLNVSLLALLLTPMTRPLARRRLLNAGS
jgi:hypothetical protein